MKVVVVGGGGREHALGWKIAQSPLVEQVIGVPGNAGWRTLGPCWTDLSDLNVELPERCREAGVELIVVGPEAPLVDGLADTLRAAGFAVVGPGADGAVLEGSKAESKAFMAKHGIATAEFGVFSDADAARAYVREHGAPIVVKVDGLAAGKGVVVATTVAQADAAITDMLDGGAFGGAGARVVIEACLPGEEVSVLALVDGETCLPLLPSQDHKRIGEGDQGPNTGGMGAYVPTGFVDEALWARIQQEVLQPTLDGLRADGIDYRGILYCGLMVHDGAPQTLEYNVRFGDPECQPLLFHMQSDLVPYLLACAEQTLATQPPLQWREGYSLCVVMASPGYPKSADTGDTIPNIDLDPGSDAMVFHAGTKLDGDEVVTAGGRVLGVTACGDDLHTARHRVYDLVDQLRWPGCQVRRDIGWRELQRNTA